MSICDACERERENIVKRASRCPITIKMNGIVKLKNEQSRKSTFYGPNLQTLKYYRL